MRTRTPRDAGSASTQDNTNVRPFQNLWIPPVLTGKTFDLTLSASKKSLWAGARTIAYCYNDTGFWGPTLFLNQGDTVQMRVKNALEEVTTLHG